MAQNTNSHVNKATNVGYFTFEIAWEVANKGKLEEQLSNSTFLVLSRQPTRT